MTLARSQSKASAKQIKSSRNVKKENIMTTGEQNLDLVGDIGASKTHVRFGDDIIEDDVRKSYYKNN